MSYSLRTSYNNEFKHDVDMCTATYSHAQQRNQQKREL